MLSNSFVFCAPGYNFQISKGIGTEIITQVVSFASYCQFGQTDWHFLRWLKRHILNKTRCHGYATRVNKHEWCCLVLLSPLLVILTENLKLLIFHLPFHLEIINNFYAMHQQASVLQLLIILRKNVHCGKEIKFIFIHTKHSWIFKLALSEIRFNQHVWLQKFI